MVACRRLEANHNIFFVVIFGVEDVYFDVTVQGEDGILGEEMFGHGAIGFRVAIIELPCF